MVGTSPSFLGSSGCVLSKAGGRAQLSKSTSIQQSLCAVPPPLLTVQGLLLLPADLCVFLETSSARHVSAEVQLSMGDSRR